MTNCSLFDLGAEITKIEQNRPWPSGMRSAVLVKTADMRVLLIGMEAGAKMKEHHAEGTVSIQVLRGTLLIQIREELTTLKTGELLSILPGVRHGVEAVAESAFLLTMAWPGGSGR